MSALSSSAEPNVQAVSTMSVQSPVRALLFDVFGTCVDWRSTVTRELHDAMHKSLNAADHSIASRVRLACDSMSDEKWAEFAQKWRNTYKRFTRGLASDASIPWKSVDDHHYDSLLQLIEEYHLSTLWDPEEVRRLSLVWHHLDPWQDSSEGIGAISQICSTATLSNGNLSLLSDLKTHANMPFTHIFSAEMFGSYKVGHSHAIFPPFAHYEACRTISPYMNA